MLVKIRTKEKCPKCGRKFAHIPKLGYICAKCKTRPRKYFMDFSWG